MGGNSFMSVLKKKVHGKSRAIMVMLLALVTVIVNTQIFVLAKMTSPKYTSLKYKLIGKITNMKISNVEYTAEEDKIWFRINYLANENKNMIWKANNANAKPVISDKNSIMKKENNYYEWNIPLINLRGSSSINVYIVNSPSKAILAGLEAGKKYSGMTITLDSNIIGKARAASITVKKTPIKADHNVNNQQQTELNNTAKDQRFLYHNSISKDGLQITSHPTIMDIQRGDLQALPSYNDTQMNPFGVDLRSYDLSSFDIGKDRLKDLLHADFDSKTIFPKKLPDGFEPSKIMEIGKNPGLGLKELHSEGITGKGIGIAIIDQNLLVDHVEYKDQLRSYEEIHWPTPAVQTSMHGPAVASIAVGKSVGVAPEADLYYIAELHGTYSENGQFDWDFRPLAQSIDRIIEINNTLPKDKKIRVISISVGWSSAQAGYREVTEAVVRAEKQGIFVVSTTLPGTNHSFMGLGKDAMSDPDNIGSYKAGLFWKDNLINIQRMNHDGILVPMDSRTTASPTGNQDYVHYDNGGLSWAVPYVAGLYALACQVDPEVTPDIFWDAAVKTGDPLIVDQYNLGNIVNPKKLIELLKK